MGLTTSGLKGPKLMNMLIEGKFDVFALIPAMIEREWQFDIAFDPFDVLKVRFHEGTWFLGIYDGENLTEFFSFLDAGGDLQEASSFFLKRLVERIIEEDGKREKNENVAHGWRIRPGRIITNVIKDWVELLPHNKITVVRDSRDGHINFQTGEYNP